MPYRPSAPGTRSAFGKAASGLNAGAGGVVGVEAVAKAPAPCVTATPECTQWVTLKGGPARSLVYRTFALDVPKPAGDRALVIDAIAPLGDAIPFPAGSPRGVLFTSLTTLGMSFYVFKLYASIKAGLKLQSLPFREVITTTLFYPAFPMGPIDASQAFDRAGLRGGFRVELLPEGVDPMDARYNVVQWENRNERGWSVGGALTDPRTGEMLKGMARMDSHRNRTDYNIYAALLGADAAAADTAFVLSRIRQVSAHEVGHTLGLQHNYIASSYERASVMDYPAPRVLVTNGAIDLSQAYATGPGAYDVWAIHWGYGIFPAASEGLPQGHRQRRPQEGVSVLERRRRPPRECCRSAHLPLGRRGHAERVPQAPDGRPSHRALTIRAPQHS